MDAEDVNGRSPLMFAAIRGSHEAFEALVLAGANQFALDNTGNSFLHFACSQVPTKNTCNEYIHECVASLLLRC